jgi:DNA-directed RNA polymerase subunit beta
MEVREFGRVGDLLPIPNLTKIQTESYRMFVQADVPTDRRKNFGLEGILNETFPIESYDGTRSLEYVRYELSRPRYSPEECRRLRLTYGAPLKLVVRLTGPEPVEEDVYLGEIPLMVPGGEFIVNGADRVIVTQLHRSPGVDFLEDTESEEKTLHSCRIIPERGSWVEVNTTKRDALIVKIDQSGRLPATLFLRAMSRQYSSTTSILREFYDVESVKLSGAKLAGRLEGCFLAEDVVNSESGEVVGEAGTPVNTEALVDDLKAAAVAAQWAVAIGQQLATCRRRGDRKVTITVKADEEMATLTVEGVDKTFEAPAYVAALESAWQADSSPLTKVIEAAGWLIAEIPSRRAIKRVVLGQAEEGPVSVQEMAELLMRAAVIKEVRDPLMLNTVKDDTVKSHEEAMERIYSRLRPGNPVQREKARAFFQERFYDANRYRLGDVGRFRMNRKLEHGVAEDEMSLQPEDVVACIQYVLALREGKGAADDIDHLENRRLRTIDELAGDELRKGFLKLKRTAQERMALKIEGAVTPRSLINSKTVSSAIEFFFARSELSQVVDQTNPLAQLTNVRRLSALGPGGLNRKRAGFEVRDVHLSHYGRVCPIETPEGTNIGLIASLSLFADVDRYGFIRTPYAKVTRGRPTGDTEFLRADQERNLRIAPASYRVRKGPEQVLARYNGDFLLSEGKDVDYMDVSPKQLVGVSAGLIPFLEHDDANRALMGSNMQRQAVPLLVTEPPLVGTGMEGTVAANSGMVVVAERAGTVETVSSTEVRVDGRPYALKKFVKLNEGTCLNQKPTVREGDKVKAGEVLADGAATRDGLLSLGRNVLVAFMPWDGYNFEDAIVVSERLVKDDFYTSIHIEEFEVEIRETKLGREEFTRDIPNVPERMLRNLDDEGIVQIGTRVLAGDVLVGKVAPKSKSELSPEEKLLHAIFGRAGEDIKNDSLVVPSGTEGIVIGAQKFSRKAYMSEAKRKENQEAISTVERTFNRRIWELYGEMIETLEEAEGGSLVSAETGEVIEVPAKRTKQRLHELEELMSSADAILVEGKSGRRKTKAFLNAFETYAHQIQELRDDRNGRVDYLRRGDELPTGVLELVKVQLATKRVLSVGDKMAGRHGNKGVIAKIVPEEDMPHLEDGTPVDLILNPLGVPSRMNLGQILETHLGWAAEKLGIRAVTPVFDGATEEEIRDLLKEAGLPETGKAILYDGRTGDAFQQQVTVGYIYMMKLLHLVDDKVHARATGPYSLVTQQPLGGKARAGGQRFGEMEVWALEAYGAAHILQELLTVKSDDVEGRTKIYESMVKGENTLEAGTPVSFEVLMNEMRGLCLNVELEKQGLGAGGLKD